MASLGGFETIAPHALNICCLRGLAAAEKDCRHVGDALPASHLLAGGFCGLKRGLSATSGLAGRGEINRRQLGAAAARKCRRKQGSGQRHSFGVQRFPLAWPALTVPAPLAGGD